MLDSDHVYTQRPKHLGAPVRIQPRQVPPGGGVEKTPLLVSALQWRSPQLHR
jgi:hypothetical protein